MKNLKYTIEPMDNGYVLSDDTEDEGSIRAVFEDREGEDGLKATESMLWYLLDLLGKSGSRYDKERLRIVREPGDKFEDGREEIGHDQ